MRASSDSVRGTAVESQGSAPSHPGVHVSPAQAKLYVSWSDTRAWVAPQSQGHPVSFSSEAIAPSCVRGGLVEGGWEGKSRPGGPRGMQRGKTRVPQAEKREQTGELSQEPLGERRYT